MLRSARTVYFKELLEVFRDRKTIIFMFVLPILLVPIVGGLAMQFVSNAANEAASKELHYAIFDGELAPEVQQGLAANESFSAVALSGSSEITPAIRDERIDFAVVLVPRDDGRVGVELHHDDATLFSDLDRVRPVIEAAANERTDAALVELGVATAAQKLVVTKPLEIVERGIASKREVLGEHLGGMVPYMLIVFAFLGALYPATDLGAGEKERGTLETLLLAPVPRTSLVAGKFGVVCTTAIISAVLGVSGMGAWLLIEGQSVAGPLGEVLRAVSMGDLALIALLTVPVAATIAALLLSVSIFAKSFKEAQSYAGPLNILLIVPAFVGMAPGVRLDAGWACVPIANVSLAVKEIVKGTLDPGLASLVFGSSLAVAAAMLAVCVVWFRREAVLFRQ